MSELAKQIKLSDKTYSRLTDMGKKNETYDDIVARILDELEESKKSKK